MAGTAMPFVKPQFFDSNGDPAAGYQLFTYDAGTSTKRTTYSDAALATPNTNPIVLDAAGRASIFLSPTSYKFVMATSTDTDPPVSPVWTMDNVQALGGFISSVDVDGTAGETFTTGQVVFLNNGVGGGTAGRWYKADANDATLFLVVAISGGLQLGIATSAGAAGVTCSVRISGRITGLSGLTTGAAQWVSTTAGALTSTDPAASGVASVIVGVADSTTSMIVCPQPPLAGYAVGDSIHSGLVSNAQQYWYGQKRFQLQPYVTIGDAIATQGIVGGVFFTDMTERSVPQNSTDLVMTDTEIPAGALNANGKALRLYVGTDTDETGTNTHLVELDIGGTQIPVRASSGTAQSFWAAEVMMIRIDSDSLEVRTTTAIPASAMNLAVQRINGLDFQAAIDLRTLGTTGATTTTSQTHFILEAVG